MSKTDSELPDTCHGCGEINNGRLFTRYEPQCDDKSDYYLCRVCDTGTRLYHTPSG